MTAIQAAALLIILAFLLIGGLTVKKHLAELLKNPRLQFEPQLILKKEPIQDLKRKYNAKTELGPL